MEVGGADQLTQRVIGFDRCARRADRNRLVRAIDRGPRGGERDIAGSALAVDERPTRTILEIGIAVTEATTIAEEIAVEIAVVAVLDAADFAVALTRRHLAAGRTAHADHRRLLNVPLEIGKAAGRDRVVQD